MNKYNCIIIEDEPLTLERTEEFVNKVLTNLDKNTLSLLSLDFIFVKTENRLEKINLTDNEGLSENSHCE